MTPLSEYSTDRNVTAANAPLEEIASGVITVAQKPTLLIVGSGRVGAELAARLVHTWRVIIVDETPQALESELFAVVHQSAIVVGTERRNETAEQQRQIIAMAQMYRIAVNVVELEGNPIEEIMNSASPS